MGAKFNSKGQMLHRAMYNEQWWDTEWDDNYILREAGHERGQEIIRRRNAANPFMADIQNQCAYNRKIQEEKELIEGFLLIPEEDEEDEGDIVIHETKHVVYNEEDDELEGFMLLPKESYGKKFRM